MKLVRYIIILSVLIITGSCVSKFFPEINETQEMIVVEGLITDQPGVNTVKLTRTMPLNEENNPKPLRGCVVTITDDDGNIYGLTESGAGIYRTNPSEFQGVIGKKYQLKILTNDMSSPNNSYESVPMEMKPVPPIDSLYFEKVNLKVRDDLVPQKQGCQIYLDTHDPDGICKHYRWNYSETWEFHIPYSIPNNVCWISDNSSVIKIKTTASQSEDRISRYPLNFVSNETDRLNVKYSLKVDQYSMNEDEFDYWSRLQSVSEETGSLYDITPASIIGNVYCTDDPNELVLGYFSVSAVASKRIFIEDNFAGLPNLYMKCPTDTIYSTPIDSIPGLNQTLWILQIFDFSMPPYKVLTKIRGCADCTVRGTKTEPSFWRDDKK
jgi:hypothetical protein